MSPKHAPRPKRPRRALPTLIDALEPRQLLTAATLPGTSLADTFVVSRGEDESQVFVDVTTSGSTTRHTYDRAATTSLTINAAGSDDRLVLDLVRRNPFLDNLITFNGDAGSDRIDVSGSADFRRRLTFAYSDYIGSAGTLTSGDRDAAFTGVENFKVSTVSLLTIVTPGGADTLTLTSPEAGHNRLSGTTIDSSGALITLRPVTFTDAETVTIDASTLETATSQHDSLTVATAGMVAANLGLLRLLPGGGTNTLTLEGGTTPFEAVAPALFYPPCP